MSTSRGKLERSSNGIIAGVCSGLADYLSIDEGVLRFAFVALAFVSGGSFIFVYIALWLLLPLKNASAGAVEVDPHSPGGEHRAQERRSFLRQWMEAHAQAHAAPPKPPAAPGMEEVRQSTGRSGAALICMLAGVMAVVAGFCFLLSMVFPVFKPAQFWPLAVMALGIVRMVLPGAEGYRMHAFAGGVFLLLAGAVLLLNTMGIARTSLPVWFDQGWPILMMAAGCLVLWKATGLTGFAAAALVLVAAFCVVGVLFCSHPGPAYHLISSASNMRHGFWPGV